MCINFTLSFEGGSADHHLIDMYDMAQALIGFQRSIALTTHLVLNGKIITQAPSLKGANIQAFPSEEGSWKMTAVVFAGIYSLSTLPNDSPLGHLIFSTYDYVIKESLGFHVDYKQSLREQYEKHKDVKEKIPQQHQVDSLIEKCNTAISEIHRPIRKKSVVGAKIFSNLGQTDANVGIPMNLKTYQYIHEEFYDKELYIITGRISSYNSNTLKGRIYVFEEGRPISFTLTDTNNEFVRLIVTSLSANAIHEYEKQYRTVSCVVRKVKTKNGDLKRYLIIRVANEIIE
ncbi:MAG: hypothetical protein K0U19_01720 [Proteobacteria bacterium]|nr:hypothetical protein [Pseudomonadota bacterium]